MEKIPCFVLTWMDHVGIKGLIDALAVYPQLQVIVVENRSRFTDPIIKPFLWDKVKEGVVDKYYLFDKNIGGYAMAGVRREHIDLIAQSKYIITTDGDIIPTSGGCLEKQIALMEKYPKIHAVSHHVWLGNLPWAGRPEKAKFILNEAWRFAIHDDCLEIPTGHHITLVNGGEYARYLNWCHGKESQTDCTHRKFCNSIGKKWVKLKEPSAINTGWDLMNDPTSAYYKLRFSKTGAHIFCTDRSCPYWLYTKNDEKYVELPYVGGSVFGTKFGE